MCHVCSVGNPPDFHCRSYGLFPDRAFDWTSLVAYRGTYSPSAQTVTYTSVECVEGYVTPVPGSDGTNGCSTDLLGYVFVGVDQGQPGFLEYEASDAVAVCDRQGFSISADWQERYFDGGVVQMPPELGGVGVREYGPTVFAGVVVLMLFPILWVTLRIVLRIFGAFRGAVARYAPAAGVRVGDFVRRPSHFLIPPRRPFDWYGDEDERTHTAREAAREERRWAREDARRDAWEDGVSTRRESW